MTDERQYIGCRWEQEVYLVDAAKVVGARMMCHGGEVITSHEMWWRPARSHRVLCPVSFRNQVSIYFRLC